VWVVPKLTLMALGTEGPQTQTPAVAGAKA